MAQELYELPKEWEWKTLKELGKFSGGGTPSKSNPDFWGGNQLWITPKDMKSEKLRDSQLKITDTAIDKSSAKLIPAGSILIVARSGILRHTLPVCINEIEATVNQDIKVFIPSKKITSAFCQKMLIGHEPMILRDLVKGGVTVESLKYQEFQNHPFPVPPLGEQERIVAKLDALFSRIDQAIAQLQHTQAQTKALWASALDAVFEATTRNQPTSPLSEICTITSSKRIHKSDYVESGIPFFRTKEIVELGSGKNISSTLYISAEQFKEIDAKFGSPKKGDLLFSAVGTIGKMWIADGRTFYFKDGNLLWLKDYSEITPDYLKHTIRITLEQQIKDKSQGAAYKAISIQNLKSFPIPVPPLAAQSKIVAQLDAISERTQALTDATSAQLEKLQALKASLLDAAFRGQL